MVLIKKFLTFIVIKKIKTFIKFVLINVFNNLFFLLFNIFYLKDF